MRRYAHRIFAGTAEFAQKAIKRPQGLFASVPFLAGSSMLYSDKLQNFLMMLVNGLGQAAIPVVGYNYGSKQSDRVKQAWKVLLPTGIVFALCGTVVFLLFSRQLLGMFSASEEMLAFGVPALRIISVMFVFAVITILCGYFASGLGNGVVNMIGGALRQLVILVPCLWLFIRFFGVGCAWFAFWASEIIACVYSLYAARKELKKKIGQR